MTISYTAEVATCRKFGCFIKLLARWKGSIYKLVWMDLLLFLLLYYGINLIYRYLLDTESQRTFESIVYYCASYSSLIPLSFVLGFYVNLVMNRWWEQYITIPWPDTVAVYVSAHVHGQDDRGRVMRRTIMRYVCLCLTLVFTMISPCAKKRFPRLKHLVEAGYLLENEKKIFESMDVAFPKYPKHWMPIVWAASIVTRARKEGFIRDDFAVKTIIDELNTFRGRCGVLLFYDFISIPLVYTQVVTIAVYSYFLCSLLAHQWTEFKKDTHEQLGFYMPVFITLQFFFYMGWLKVAETLINPFGDDDDDFEVNWMIDRNLQVAYLIVDEMHHEHPELVRDQYWDEVYPSEFPYESDIARSNPPQHSTAKYDEIPSPELPMPQFSDKLIKDIKVKINSGINLSSEIFNDILTRLTQALEERTTQGSQQISGQSITGNSMSNIECIQNETTYDLQGIQQVERGIRPPVLLLEDSNASENEEDEKDFVEENYEEEHKEDKSSSSYDSDTSSDSDPFERLRLERQQQRFQRMHTYVTKYFGSHVQLVMPATMPREITKKSKATQTNTSTQFTPKTWGETMELPQSHGIIASENSSQSKESMESNLKLILVNLPLKHDEVEVDGRLETLNSGDHQNAQDEDINTLYLQEPSNSEDQLSDTIAIEDSNAKIENVD
ncbi:bestrophin-4-like [Haematobia irritans]|uniref:bestrophin-4-like n=1 Tax=Haematobia irritans TaxID=7368 RepID=UPI003F4FEC4B